jgi:hypothetical protein
MSVSPQSKGLVSTHLGNYEILNSHTFKVNVYSCTCTCMTN